MNAPNPNYVGGLLARNLGFGLFANMYDPKYRTPRSIEMNIGVQWEIRNGMIFNADFVRNVQTHYFLGVDENNTGDVHYFDKVAAQRAIAATLGACGISTVDQAIAACPGLHPGGGGASMADFASRGLTSSADFDQPCAVLFGYPCALPGINPNAPPLPFLKPIGRSVYNGLQTKLTQEMQHPFREVSALDFQASYALSRFENAGGIGFVIIPNASKTGDVIDVVDVFALQDGMFKLQQRGAAGQKLAIIQQLSRKIDQAAAERRKGVVVHP